jgi:hypothetical protein
MVFQLSGMLRLCHFARRVKLRPAGGGGRGVYTKSRDTCYMGCIRPGISATLSVCNSRERSYRGLSPRIR